MVSTGSSLQAADSVLIHAAVLGRCLQCSKLADYSELLSLLCGDKAGCRCERCLIHVESYCPAQTNCKH